MDAAESLLNTIRIPRKIVVDHQIGSLKIQAFSCSIGRHKDTHPWIVDETFLHFLALVPIHAAMNGFDGLGHAKQCSDTTFEILKSIPMLGEHNHLVRLIRRTGIQHPALQDIA